MKIANLRREIKGKKARKNELSSSFFKFSIVSMQIKLNFLKN